ncbi:MAG: response regulator transcription factor [Cyclobacteriaceae bacterium]|nr:response regulator transcription factor [Cyclobacteriaceae bacterium]
MKEISILLVEDHKMVREGLRLIFQDDSEFLIVGEASNGIEGLKFLENNQVDIILTDINMPQMDGVEFVKEVKNRNPAQAIIALSMLGESQHIKKMLAAGASGYLLKNCGSNELKKAIRMVHDGQSYYSSEVTEIIMENLTKSKKSKIALEVPLSNREKEVLHLIVKEYSNQEIADTLFISPRTVDAHKRNLLDKTGSKNIAGLVLFAIERRLFDDV